MMTLGEKVTRRLSAIDRSQSWLARAVGSTSATVSRVCGGTVTGYELANRIARTLDVPAAWLIDNSLDYPPPNGRSDTIAPPVCRFAPEPMTWQQKIRRLVGSRNKSELSRQAGLPASAIDAVVNKGRMPLAENGIKIARALGVPADWLFDDARPWPPPSGSSIPPFPIYPWPPAGITWVEVQFAISEYVARRAVLLAASNGESAAGDPAGGNGVHGHVKEDDRQRQGTANSTTHDPDG